MDRLNDESAATIFAAGALSAIDGIPMSEKDAGFLVESAMKKVAARSFQEDDDEDDDDNEGTWWSRNKHWAIPALVGTGAFIIGGDAGRNYRDSSYIVGAGRRLLDTAKSLLGIPNSRYYDLFTNATDDGYMEYKRRLSSVGKKEPEGNEALMR